MKVFSFVAIERSRLTITLWQGVIKLLVVAYLFLGQLSAGLRQGGVPLQGASSTWEHQTLQAVSSLLQVHSPGPLGSSPCLKGRAVRGVVLHLQLLGWCGDLWTTVAGQHPSRGSCRLCTATQCSPRNGSFSEMLPNSLKTGCHRWRIHYFLLQVKRGITLILPSGISWSSWAQFL